MRVLEDDRSSRFDKGQDHVDQFGSGAVTPVVILQRVQHQASHIGVDKLLSVMEASLE